MRLSVLQGLCADVILGQHSQQQHDSVVLQYGAKLPPIVLCVLTTLHVDAQELFANLPADCHSIVAQISMIANLLRKKHNVNWRRHG